MSAILETNLSLPLFGRGKVRDTYDLGDRLLIIATDRISAFDFGLPNGIPDKGAVLNQLSAFWFEKTAHIVPNHVVKVITSPSMLAGLVSPGVACPDYLTGRAMVVRKAERIPVECVVRGYISVQIQRDRVRHGHAARPQREPAIGPAAIHTDHQGRYRTRRTTYAGADG